MWDAGIVMSDQGDQNKDYDAVVAGAGPAGSTAALKLSEAGFSTLMIDQKMEIGAPVICADLVNLSFPDFREIAEDKRIVLSRPAHVELKSGSNSLKFFPSGKEGDAFNSVVERDRLDKEMASRAIMSGARLKIRTELIGASEENDIIELSYKTGGKTIKVRTRNLIVATGFQGQVNNWSRDTTTAYSFDFRRKISPNENATPVIELRSDHSLNYNVPRNNGQTNCIMINEGSGKVESVPESIIKGAGSIIRGSKHLLLPKDVNFGQGRILYAGSAAGLYDRFFMSGFREAVFSGSLAANAIIESGEGSLESYRQNLEKHVYQGMEVQKRFRDALYRSGTEKIHELFLKLSEFEYNEVSVLELINRSGFSINEIENILGIETS